MTEQTPLQQAQEIFRRATKLCQDLAAAEEAAKKIPETLQEQFPAAPYEQPMPDLPKLKAAIREAELKTEHTAQHGDTGDIVDAAVEEGNAWRAYANGLEQFLAAAGRHVRGADGPGRVPVPLATLTYAATALEGSSDNGDRYAALQIREAIAKHPSPEAYMATKRAQPSPWEAEVQPLTTYDAGEGRITTGGKTYDLIDPATRPQAVKPETVQEQA